MPVPYSTRLFWDVAPEAIDPDQHAPHIIARVAERGTLAEWKACVEYYGPEKVRQVIETKRGVPDDIKAFWRKMWTEGMMLEVHPEVLPREAAEILSRMGEVLPPGALLCGGTAVALYLGHRESEDLDFLTPNEFEVNEVERAIKNEWDQLADIDRARNHTVHATIQGVKVSIIRQRGIELTPGTEFLGVTVADLDTLTALKLNAIAGRGSKRDFIDLYFICQHRGLGVSDLMENAYRRIQGLNDAHLLRSLAYFEDAEGEIMPRMLVPCEWSKVKQFFEAGVHSYMRKIGGWPL